MTNTDCSKVIFGFWTGDNPMSETRQRCWESFGITGLKPVLVTAETLSGWILPEHPLHPTYEFLSPVHRSDYLRPYFMHHHGGGYADIKHQTGSWLPAVERVLSSSWLVGAGNRETRGGSAWLEPDTEGHYHIHSWRVPKWGARGLTHLMRAARPLLIGNNNFYFKPRCFYTRLWLAEAERRLDRIAPLLMKNPPRSIRDRLGGLDDNPSAYPLPWQHIMGEINHPLSLAFFPVLHRGLPRPRYTEYL